MHPERSRLQGLINVLRFNYPLYVVAGVTIAAGLILSLVLKTPYAIYIRMLAALSITQFAFSVAATALAYDLSGFYTFDWLPKHVPPGARILNISAGFDESTVEIRNRYPAATVRAYDFFDPERHTEPSIRRARRFLPPAPDCLPMSTDQIPEPEASIDLICLILAAHEIRTVAERRRFLKELARILRPGGEVIVVEHLRDIPNIVAYNLGAFHFFSKRRWLSDFAAAGLQLRSSGRLNVFIHAFSLVRRS